MKIEATGINGNKTKGRRQKPTARLVRKLEREIELNKEEIRILKEQLGAKASYPGNSTSKASKNKKRSKK